MHGGDNKEGHVDLWIAFDGYGESSDCAGQENHKQKQQRGA